MLPLLRNTFIFALFFGVIILSIGGVTRAEIDTAIASYAALNTYSIRKNNEDKVYYIESTRKRKDGAGPSQKSFGTGFLLTEEGHILTASHVVLQADTDTVVTTTGRSHSAVNSPQPLEFIRRDPDLDAVLLQLPNTAKKLRGVTIGNSKLVPEEAPLYVLGFPIPLLNINSGNGILTSKRGPNGRWVTSIPLNRGNSGGPIFDIKGHVIAMAIGGADESQGITYATPIRYLKGLIDMVTLNASSLRVHITSDKKEASRQFAFYQAVGHEQEQTTDETFCLPQNYKVTNFTPTIATQNGSDTKLISVEPVAASPNCVVMTAHVKGLGVETIGPITTEYKGRGWIGGDLVIRGEKAK